MQFKEFLQQIDNQAFEGLLLASPSPFLFQFYKVYLFNLAIRLRHSFLAKYLLRVVDLDSKFLKTLRHRASIDPSERWGKKIRPSSYQLIDCLKPTFKILSSRIDHLTEPPTLDDWRISIGQTTFFHLNFISSILASRASERICQFMMPDQITSSFSFLSSLQVQFLLQVTDFSSGLSFASCSFLERVGIYGRILRKRPVLSRTTFISVSYFILPCHRLIMELIERKFFMKFFTSSHFIPNFFTPSLNI